MIPGFPFLISGMHLHLLKPDIVFPVFQMIDVHLGPDPNLAVRPGVGAAQGNRRAGMGLVGLCFLS